MSYPGKENSVGTLAGQTGIGPRPARLGRTPRGDRYARASQTANHANGHSHNNVAGTERVGSVIAGGAMAIYGLMRGGIAGWASALLGSVMVHRGVTGHCEVYHAMGLNTAGPHSSHASLVGNEGVRVDCSLTVNKSADELWRFWRDFTNLPRFMTHLKSVTVLEGDGRKTRWTVEAPAGRTVSWDAEIVSEREGEMIAWRSLPDADVDNAGSIRFTPEPHGFGTQIRVQMLYSPPAGRVGAMVAKLFGKSAEQQITDDLRRFKQLMETGVVPTISGQASGRGRD